MGGYPAAWPVDRERPRIGDAHTELELQAAGRRHDVVAACNLADLGFASTDATAAIDVGPKRRSSADRIGGRGELSAGVGVADELDGYGTAVGVKRCSQVLEEGHWRSIVEYLKQVRPSVAIKVGSSVRASVGVEARLDASCCGLLGKLSTGVHVQPIRLVEATVAAVCASGVEVFPTVVVEVGEDGAPGKPSRNRCVIDDEGSLSRFVELIDEQFVGTGCAANLSCRVVAVGEVEVAIVVDIGHSH